jgi:hypothetical protein
VVVAGALLFLTGIATTNYNKESIRRQLAFEFKREHKKPLPATLITQKNLAHYGEIMPFALPERASDWCMSPGFVPLDYKECDSNLPINRIPLIGGLTNALKFVLLGAIMSYEEGRCFFIDDSNSHLVIKATISSNKLSVLQRYFEPMGLEPNSRLVKSAIAENRVETKDWKKLWGPLQDRRVLDSKHFIEYLSRDEIDGHRLKFITLIRMWRPKTYVRDSACLELENHGLSKDYLALSVRRGDKQGMEHFVIPTVDQYIDAAEKAIRVSFGGIEPSIFVATDDCTVMQEFRDLRPTWNFVSQCDLEQHAADSGFSYADMVNWTPDDMDRHYSKFMAELLGLSSAKFVIGVSYTNVAWWILFMRRGIMHEIQFLDDTAPNTAASW